MPRPFTDGSYFSDGTGFTEPEGEFSPSDPADTILIIEEDFIMASAFISMVAGSPKPIRYVIQDTLGNGVILTDARWVMVRELGDTLPVLQKALNSGIVTGTPGHYDVQFTEAETIGLEGQYVHELKGRVSGVPKSFNQGIIEFRRPIVGTL